MTTVQLILALTAANGWFLQQLDVNNAFMKDVCMTLPPSFIVSQSNQVCHLKKSIYGLKQAR